ncbi:MAG: ribosome silencing factor [Armatimonadetes bacterium]|nr:ribosome silencing factor [Armatimonadota bacterium]
MDSRQKAQVIIAAAEERKANGVTALDLQGLTLIADYFIIGSGNSRVHIRAVADGIMEKMGESGFKSKRSEGYAEAQWILLDYQDVVVHIFSEEMRAYYDLETFWKSADRIYPSSEEGEPP